MAVLCNDAELQAHDGLWSVSGDPMEGALVVLAHKAGLDPHAVRTNNPRVSEIPFDSVQKFMATVHRLPDGRHLGCVKGAPEQVLDMCVAQGSAADAAPLSRAEWETAIDRLAHAGYRVMAVAARPLTKADCAADEAIQNLTLIGLVGLQLQLKQT